MFKKKAYWPFFVFIQFSSKGNLYDVHRVFLFFQVFTFISGMLKILKYNYYLHYICGMCCVFSKQYWMHWEEIKIILYNEKLFVWLFLQFFWITSIRYLCTYRKEYFVSENIPIFFPYAEKMEPRNHSVCLNSIYI